MHFLNTIYVNDSASVSADNRTDYHWFTSKLAHENQHEYDWKKVVWGDKGYDITKDLDGDLLNDEWEENNIEGHPSDQDFSKYREWEDNRAYEVEKNYPDMSKDRDFAYPGSNY
jgi:hypothetical protein